jgi:hypothetical protein
MDDIAKQDIAKQDRADPTTNQIVASQLCRRCHFFPASPRIGGYCSWDCHDADEDSDAYGSDTNSNSAGDEERERWAYPWPTVGQRVMPWRSTRRSAPVVRPNPAPDDPTRTRTGGFEAS